MSVYTVLVLKYSSRCKVFTTLLVTKRHYLTDASASWDRTVVKINQFIVAQLAAYGKPTMISCRLFDGGIVTVCFTNLYTLKNIQQGLRELCSCYLIFHCYHKHLVVKM